MSVFLPKVIIISEYIIQRSVCQEPRSSSLQKVKKRNKEWPMWNKPRNTDSSEFTQNAVGRDNWQKNESHPMLFHSQFWCFYFRNKAHWTKHWRATVALFCVTSILHWKKISSQDQSSSSLWDQKKHFIVKISDCISCLHFCPVAGHGMSCSLSSPMQTASSHQSEEFFLLLPPTSLFLCCQQIEVVPESKLLHLPFTLQLHY